MTGFETQRKRTALITSKAELDKLPKNKLIEFNKQTLQVCARHGCDRKASIRHCNETRVSLGMDLHDNVNHQTEDELILVNITAMELAHSIDIDNLMK